MTDRLTLNLGLRYDYVDGMPIDQSTQSELPWRCRRRARRDASTGRRSRTSARAAGATRTTSSRASASPTTCTGNGRNVIRGGWGVYTDFGYTNSNVLFAAIDAAGGHGQVFFVNNPAGIRKAGRHRSSAPADPLSTIAHLNEVNPTLPPLLGQVVSPRLEQPYTRQTNLGWAHQLDTVDGDHG